MFKQQYGIGDVVRLFFREKDQSANERVWDIFLNSKIFSIRTRNDADDDGISALTITRGTNTAIDSISLGSKLNISGLVNVLPGNAPSAPSNGDIWITTAGLYYRANGTTFGPLGQGFGDGTVTSVGLSMPSIFTVSGSPVTGGGTLSVTANGTSGGIPYFSSTSTFARVLVLTQYALLVGGGAGAGPEPVSGLGLSNQVLHGNVSGPPTWGKVALSTDVAGTLPVSSGGTGGTTPSIARTNLGLVIGQDVQAYHPNLTSVASGNYVSAFNTRTGAISLTSGDVTTALTFTPENAANRGTASGYASLDADGKLPTTQLPDLAITNTFVVATEEAMLALTAQVGDIVVRTDIETSFVLKTAGASTLANWQQILAPSGLAQVSVALAMPTDVFNVSGSPVTSEGTLTVTLDTQTANTVFAGPSTGSATAPTFRALVADDIPNISANKITSGTLPVSRGGTGLSSVGTANQILGVQDPNSGGLEYKTLTAGSGISITHGAGSITITSTGSGSGTVTSVGLTVPTGLSVTPASITTSGTFAVTLAAGYSIPTTASQTNWDTAYTDRLKWDGSSSGLTASTGRTSLGATTVGSNLFTLTNPGAVSFLRLNANNTVTALNALDFRSAIGAGTGSGNGTVTSVGLTVPTGLSVSPASITSSGTFSITLASGYSIPTTASQTNWDTAYTDRMKWDGSDTGLTASTGRISLGASTVGSNIFTLVNPGAVSFMRINADHTVDALSAANFRTAIGAGSGDGTVTGVTASSPLSSSGGAAPNITLSGTVGVSNGGTGLSTTPTNGQLLIGNGTGYTLANLVAGSNITITNTAEGIEIASGGGGGGGAGGGSVTSVGLSAPANIFNIAGGPVTTSGTLALTLDNQNANTVFAGPTGGSAAEPGFRSLASADIPALSTDTLTSGTLPVARGGTGLSSLGASNQVLKVNSSGTALEFAPSSPQLGSNRQTVLSGPRNGLYASYLTSGAGLTVGINGSVTPVELSFANGFNNGPLDYFEQITTNVSGAWTLPANATSYLYIERTDASALTYGSTTLQPYYIDSNTYYTQLVVEVYDYHSSPGTWNHGATLNEITFTVKKETSGFESDQTYLYTVSSTEAYDSRMNGVPFYWNHANYFNKSNLNDGATAYSVSNSILLMYGPTEPSPARPGMGDWARFLITFPEMPVGALTMTVNIGDSQGHTPVTVSVYAVTGTYNKAQHLNVRTNSGLTLLGSVSPGDNVTTPTTYTVFENLNTESLVENRFKFDIAQMKMYKQVSGSLVNTNAIFVGEATTNATGVTNLVNYAYRGFFVTPRQTHGGSNTSYRFNHNLGCLPLYFRHVGMVGISNPTTNEYNEPIHYATSSTAFHGSTLAYVGTLSAYIMVRGSGVRGYVGSSTAALGWGRLIVSRGW